MATAVAATLALAACGGGGDNGAATFAPIGNIVPPAPPAPPEPPPPPPPPPAPAPAPAVNTFMYEQVPYPADTAAFLSALNSQGARGFRFLSPLTAPLSGAGADVYMKTGDATYVYELKSQPADANAFVAQANEAGGRGLRWVGAISVNGTTVLLYRKDSDISGTYTYRTETPAASKADYIARGNAQGADGYFNTVPAYGFGGSSAAVFEKSSLGSATFAYEVVDDAPDTSGALAQFDAQGARGYRYRGPYIFGGASGSIFVKDLSQASTFSYQALTSQDTLEAAIVQSNTVGADGFGFVGPLIVGGEARTYYYKASNCTGLALCSPTGPFGL